MKKRLLYIAFMLLWALFFNSCAKIEPLPDVAQPVIVQYADKSVFTVGDTAITTGAIKDYEQGSDLVVKLTVSSSSPLTRFFVKTMNDLVSAKSRILRTEPADAIDASGNFVKKLNKVVVYYDYVIHPGIAVGYNLNLIFNFENEMHYIGTSTKQFTLIKAGSTNGKRLTFIDCSWGCWNHRAIGSEGNLDLTLDNGRDGGTVTTQRGPFFSLNLRTDIFRSTDAITNAANINFVGFNPMATASTDGRLALNQYYLISPSDTTLTTYTYAGALVARITLAGGGVGQTTNISVGGITALATYLTSTTVTATNYVNANKAAYAAKGINLTSSGAVISYTALTNNIAAFNYETKVVPVAVPNQAQCLYGNDEFINDELSTPKARNNKYINLRKCVRAMERKVISSPPGQGLIVTYFKRLDNITNALGDSVSLDYFSVLTHDNEFDKLLGNIAASKNTVAGPMAFNQVWGFVCSDGSRGLLKTSPATDYWDPMIYQLVNNTTIPSKVAVDAPNASYKNLYCLIKFQEKE